MRIDFQLPEIDLTFLDSLNLQWEAIKSDNMLWVIIYSYPVPNGYTQQIVDVAIKIETGYPRTPLDMAYFSPHLQRRDGKNINAISFQMIDGKQFQRWSRHRTPENPWREGIDDLSSHLSLISFWFEQEFIKNPHGIAA